MEDRDEEVRNVDSSKIDNDNSAIQESSRSDVSNQANEHDNNNKSDSDADGPPKGSDSSQNNTEEAQSASSQSSTTTKKPIAREGDYDWGHVLGKGTFGKVRLATLKGTNKQYAIKIMKKSFLQKNKKSKDIVFREREILHHVDSHPFVITLHNTFQSPDNLYFVMDYCPNGEFLDSIKKAGGSLSIECTKHYTAEMLIALEYLHSKGVMHRDFKPENILLTHSYHIKVIDFGTAKIVGRDRSGSVGQGTPDYMSPESAGTFEGGSCDYRADLWSLGVIIYQCLTGQLPFKGADTWDTLRRIRQLDFVWPQGFPADALDLCKKLLVPEGERLDHEQIKAHPFFAGVDWDDLANSTPPPFTPMDPLPIFPKRSQTTVVLASEESEEDEDDATSSDSTKSGTEPDADIGADQIGQDPKWERILNSGEKIVRSGIVFKKRRVLNVKRRQLILTTEPRLVYIDPATMRLMGSIPYNTLQSAVLKDKSHFVIRTQGRDYQFEDKTNEAQAWVSAINDLKKSSK